MKEEAAICIKGWMRQALTQACWTLCLLTMLAAPRAFGQARQERSLDADWRFLLGDPRGGEIPAFDDSAWRSVTVPHDWSIEGKFSKENPAGENGGFLPGGIGWYRKSFTLPAGGSGKRVTIAFDGVMANSDVWINGALLGHRPDGTVSFQYDLTPRLHFGPSSPNIVAVRVDNSAQPAARWYTGAGINRHVRLILTERVYIQTDSLYVTTPDISSARATIHVQTVASSSATGPRNLSLHLSVDGPDGVRVLERESREQSIGPAGTMAFTETVSIPRPRLWSLDDPALYHLTAELRENKRALDQETCTFGIRDARFAADTGFHLNGQNLKIKGVCLHEEAGAFGSAVPRNIARARLIALKNLGVNAIRTAHNPPSPDMLALCDELGLLVMDEFFDCWTVAKRPFDYHLYFSEWSDRDARDAVMRDRNHPCVILYSIGNEIRDTRQGNAARRILARLRDVVHAADPTRPVTQALFRPNASHDYDNGLADELDVVGQNYRENELIAAHIAKPTRKIISTENGHDRKAWLLLRDNPFYAGQFLWTGFDYLGESGQWPAIGNASGLFDRTGNRYPAAYERASWWSHRPMAAIARRTAPGANAPTDPGYEPYIKRPPTLFADWTPWNLNPHAETVEVYSNCEQVELFLNGQSSGAQARPGDASPRVWRVLFSPGTLKAVGRNSGQEAAVCQLQTAGTPAKILLSAERQSIHRGWDNCLQVRAVVVDRNNVPVPGASDLVHFAVNGPGRIAAVDNGDINSHEPFRADQRHAYQGRCSAFVVGEADHGTITITAAASGLSAGSLSLELEGP